MNTFPFQSSKFVRTKNSQNNNNNNNNEEKKGFVLLCDGVRSYTAMMNGFLNILI